MASRQTLEQSAETELRSHGIYDRMQPNDQVPFCNLSICGAVWEFPQILLWLNAENDHINQIFTSFEFSFKYNILYEASSQ